MNRYPYAVGHLMAVPYRKVADLAELSEQEKLELLDLASHAQRLLREVVKAQGFNIGLNLGRAAGAGVVDHLHLHIVPRWEGDNNFMPVLSGARPVRFAGGDVCEIAPDAGRDAVRSSAGLQDFADSATGFILISALTLISAFSLSVF